MVAEQVVATRPNLPRARLRPERFRDDEQRATDDDDDDDEHVDYGEAEPILNNASRTGYFGVTVRSDRHVMPRPFQARVRSGDRMLALGSFATAEQAARVAAGCVRHLRGKQADPLCQPPHEESVLPPPPPPPPPPSPPPPLIKSKNETTTGYFGVSRCPSQGKRGQAPRYQAKAFGVYLGKFMTPEAAARAISTKHPELALAQEEAEEREPPSPNPPPPQSLPLIKSKTGSVTGYFGVSRCPSQGKKGQAPMYQAKVFGVYLGRFATAEAAARAISARYPEHALAQQEEAAQQTRARPRSKTPQRKTGPRSRGGRAATRRASPEPTPEDAETDVTEDDLPIDPDAFFAFEEPLPPSSPPPPPKPAMTCRVVDARRLDALRENVGLAATFTFKKSSLGQPSFAFSPPPPPPAPTLKRLLDFDGAITAYAQIRKKSRSTK